MEGLIIENIDNNIVLKLSKQKFDFNYIIALISRLEMEALTQKADFNDEILSLADEIDSNWWNQHGNSFLKNVNQ